MKNSAALRFAGDIQLKEVKLTSLNGNTVNIINQIMSIEIYEDLFSPFISASIVLRESQDFLNNLPLIGEEYITLTLDTPSVNTPITGRFYVYKITDREYLKERETVYTIKCISEEYVNDVNNKLTTHVSGNIGESAKLLLGKSGLNTKKNVVIEQTSNVTKFVANYWSPSKCLSMLTTSAANINNSSTYLFFENREGFNFRTIEELTKAKTYQSFIKDNYTRTLVSSNSNSTVVSVEEDYKRILDFSVPTVTDYMKDVQSGRIKSRMISHDILTKRYTVKDYNLKKDKKPSTLLNDYTAYSKYAISNPGSTMFVLPRYYGNFSNFSDVTNYKTIQRRMSFFQSLEKFKINIQVPGRTDYTVGQVVSVTLPKAAQITQEDASTKDEMLSGRYLISAISHVINRDSHTCHMELIKNSIIKDLSKN